MEASAIKISNQFRAMAIRSVAAIFLFVMTYVALVSLAVLFTIACGYLGITIIVFKPMVLTIMLGLGLIGLGILILIFLLKFVFNRNKADRSHLVEITAADEPVLFEFISGIVDEIKTGFPKKVYLSSEVNASVFYDSSFWSMFLPVKKNLQIGLGLMNAVSVQELKAILAHEFGHFSQKSMKVGSYVYNVNTVIYSMLYDNSGYNNIINQWSGVSNYFNLFAGIAVKIVTGIQWVLKKVYEVVNLNYLALSREMEFHADAVAAEVAGSQALIDSLLRLDLADQSLNAVYNYYNSKFEEAEKTDNFYPQQLYVMNFIAARYELNVENGLPKVEPDTYNRFNKSKLVLKDQWSSHPSTGDRIQALAILNKVRNCDARGISSELFSDAEAIQTLFTDRLFTGIQYPRDPVVHGLTDFETNYTAQYLKYSFPDAYKGYFDERNPLIQDGDYTCSNLVRPEKTLQELFSDETLDLIYISASLTSDLSILDQISSGALSLKTFDYDGIKYVPADGSLLVERVKGELQVLTDQLKVKDEEIFDWFYRYAALNGKSEEFKQSYFDYKKALEIFSHQREIHEQMLTACDFIQVTTPFEVIREKIKEVKKIECVFIEQIRLILADEFCCSEISSVLRSRFEDYLAEDWKYFLGTSYFDKELNLLFSAMNDFNWIANRIHFVKKEHLLKGQLELVYSLSSVCGD